MSFVKVISIIRPEKLENVESILKKLNVPGISVFHIKGYGEYENFFRHDHKVEHLQLEVYIGKNRGTEIAESIMEAAYTGCEGDGIVTIMPVDSVYHIRSRKKCSDDVC
ncbi:MAG: P-II family nitrogen regulator [Gammaproteobacteria bacterium]|nr:P-II family nitrogen regulator [Gammaproteobacteria bacterium]